MISLEVSTLNKMGLEVVEGNNMDTALPIASKKTEQAVYSNGKNGWSEKITICKMKMEKFILYVLDMTIEFTGCLIKDDNLLILLLMGNTCLRKTNMEIHQ